MKKIDHSSLDGHLLQTLVALVETGSVTAAAQRMGITQSAVSNLLGRLRAITGDPLFVKSGRGVVATERAGMLTGQARELLASMERFAASEAFDPARWETTVTVAANDFQRDVLLPPLMARLRTTAPGVCLRIIPSGIPSLQLLRDRHCHLAISPRPPDGADIMQKQLFDDQYRVFFDPTVRSAPRTLAAYLASDHITVVYDPSRPLDLDQWMESQGLKRRFGVTVPGFAGLAPFIRGSKLLATVPGMLQSHLLRGLACAKVPIDCPRMPMYLLWHLRHQHEPAHRWLRGELEAIVAPAIALARRS